jgi:hypothetical protein
MLNANVICHIWQKKAIVLIKSVYIFTYILFVVFTCLFNTSCLSRIPSNERCNFSSAFSEPERCFGGIGDRCKGVPIIAPMYFNEYNCTVSGYMSIGSMLHDKCCIRTLNTGYKCAFPDEKTSKCREEWDKAVRDSLCSVFSAKRQWVVTFGPYPIDNEGDCSADCATLSLRAPSGAAVDLADQIYCENGCIKSKNGEVISHEDFCGTYCICQ